MILINFYMAAVRVVLLVSMGLEIDNVIETNVTKLIAQAINFILVVI